MNLRDLDLNLLRTLDVPLEEQQVSRAALRLGVGQPAVSHALGRLRIATTDYGLAIALPQVRASCRQSVQVVPGCDSMC